MGYYEAFVSVNVDFVNRKVTIDPSESFFSLDESILYVFFCTLDTTCVLNIVRIGWNLNYQTNTLTFGFIILLSWIEMAVYQWNVMEVYQQNRSIIF